MTRTEQLAERLHDRLGQYLRIGRAEGRCVSITTRLLPCVGEPSEWVRCVISLRREGKRQERHVRGWLDELVIERTGEAA